MFTGAHPSAIVVRTPLLQKTWNSIPRSQEQSYHNHQIFVKLISRKKYHQIIIIGATPTTITQGWKSVCWCLHHNRQTDKIILSHTFKTTKICSLRTFPTTPYNNYYYHHHDQSYSQWIFFSLVPKNHKIAVAIDLSTSTTTTTSLLGYTHVPIVRFFTILLTVKSWKSNISILINASYITNMFIVLRFYEERERA
jgi:hypothetical protein